MSIAGFLLFAVAVQASPSSPSFDCAKAADPIAQTICADPKLADSDTTMARLFSAVRTSAFGQGPSGELAAQREWIKQREHCRVIDKRIYKSREDCLASSYNDRNHDLAIAALFAEPALSLQTLRKLDPEAAPLYEAIVLYANGPKGWTWKGSSQMQKLLQPYFDKFQSNQEWSYGRDLLANEGITTLPDTLNSEKTFIDFLQISSVNLQDRGAPPLLPCAAILRRPALLGASAPLFGGAGDNFIFLTDCTNTLPPLPKFDTLVGKINSSWPKCEGTIRFWIYRSFNQLQDEARIANDNMVRFASSKEGRDTRIPKLRGVPPAQVSAAISELTLYYQRYRKAAPADGRAFARFKVRELMTKGHECD